MKSYDVIIVGRGLSALSTAWHLKRLGIRRLAIIAPKRDTSNCASCSGHTATASLFENISRTVHNLGEDVAQDLLSLARHGFSQLADFIDRWDMANATGQVIRLSLSDHETREMDVATRWLENHGYPASHDKKRRSSSGCHSTQYDGAAAVSFDMGILLEHLENDINVDTMLTTVSSIERHSSEIVVHTSCGEKYPCEIVVTACHEGIKTLVPELANALINHADQLIELELQQGRIALAPGDHLLAGHGHFWLTYTHRKRLVAGGATFLRKWGGIEADRALVMDTVSKTIKETWEDVLRIRLSDPIYAHGLIELYACDERPIIGPMYGDSRVLVTSGYRNSGASFAMAAGHGLAEFIAAGTSKSIPAAFLPSRLRSLPEGP